MSNGYWGKVLRVNLTSGKISIEEYNEKWYRMFLGGWNLIAYTLLNEVPGDTDPLGPDNKCIFAAGVMTGVRMPGSGRNAVGAKSPLTGCFGEADVGGFWGAELKLAGWDGVIIEGVSEKPVYLWINDEQVEIRDAAHLWGKKTGDVHHMLQEELGGKRVRVTQIGPAGEKLALHACVLNDINHAAGRCGLGAVLGSKKLRAIATRGSKTVPVFNAEFIKGMSAWTKEIIESDPTMRVLHNYGQAGFVASQNEGGWLPTRNFRQGQFEGAAKIEGVRMAKTMKVRSDTCFSCSVACKQAVKSGAPYHVDPIYGGPEYENTAALGSTCGVDDLEAICKANELCNAYGLDTISTGVTVAWAMEAYERGVLTRKDTGGIDLHFGNAPALVQIVEAIGKREGFGDWLAQGTYRCAQELGRDSLEFAVQTRKQESPMHDPRVKYSMDLGYAISPTGADHMHVMDEHETHYSQSAKASLQQIGVLEVSPVDQIGPDKVRVFRHMTNWNVLWNCVGLCQNFYPITRRLMEQIVNATTGWDVSIMALQETGERGLDMAREFNRRCGQTAADDVPPPRYFEPLENGPMQGHYVRREEFAGALQAYYDMMGWDRETGAPTDAKLYSLGLDWVVRQRQAEK